MKNLKNPLLVLLFFLNLNLYAQQYCSDTIANADFKSVFLYANDNELTFPITELSENNFISFRFDDLDDSQKNLSYRIILCDPNWMKSEVFEQDYLSGFNQNSFPDIQYSFNAKQSYRHFYLQIPNNDVSLLLPGNYCIEVFDDNEPDTILIRKRFMFYQEKAKIDAKIVIPRNAQFSLSHQEITAEVDVSNISDFFSSNNMSLSVYQNFNINPVVSFDNFSHISGNVLKYDSNGKKLIKAYTEFQHVDAKDYKFKEMRTNRIFLENNSVNYELITDKHQVYGAYLFKPDLNGNFLIKDEWAADSHQEADYVNVLFSLKSEYLSPSDKVYLWGRFTNYTFSPNYKMDYDFEKQLFIKSIKLKSGYYNYEYRIPEKKYLEPSYQLTENQYLVLFYYFDIYLQAYLLLGKQDIRSQTK